jgi:hypothetical protein
MIDPMPRQDLQQPPTAREAELLAEIGRLRAALSLTRRADDLREFYHRLPNDRARPGGKKSSKQHAKDMWLLAFRKAAKQAREALSEKEVE